MSNQSVSNQKGFSLIELIVALAVVSLIAYLGSDVIARSLFSTQQGSVSRTMLEIRTDFVKLIRDNSSWERTLDVDPSFACWKDEAVECPITPAGTGSAFRPLQSNGSFFQDEVGTGYDPLSSATLGFDRNGQVCNSFNGTDSLTCPFRFDFTWRPLCPPPAVGPCYRPAIEVTINFQVAENQRSLLFYPADSLDQVVIRAGESRIVDPGAAPFNCPFGEVIVSIDQNTGHPNCEVLDGI